MIHIIEMIKKIIPEAVEVLERRYMILRTIYYYEPIGRRLLASQLNLGERIVRADANILKEQGLLKSDLLGMYLTKDGKNLVEDFLEIYKDLNGLSQLQGVLNKSLGVENIIVIPGDSKEGDLVSKEMGKITSNILKRTIKDNHIIGITGGSTMAKVAEEMVEDKKYDDILVIPARGGLGSQLEAQANSIAAKISEKLGGQYRLFNVPDTLDKEAMEALLKNQEIKDTIHLINHIDVLVFGIGSANTMAHRRHLPEERINYLLEKGAVAEAFGHYFDIQGNDLWEYETIGLSLERFKEINHIIGVAGGEEKAEAIIAITSLRKDINIVTDEAAARKILKLLNKKN